MSAPSDAVWHLTIASYNIHIGIGRDGRFVPHRIASVLTEIDADVFALQEVPLGGAGQFDMLDFLRRETGLEAIAGPTLDGSTGAYGNALLTRHRVSSAANIDLSVGRREPRAALDVKLDCHGRALRVIATHLGLRPFERRTQIRRLLELCALDAATPTVLTGDLNEWFLWGRPLRWLRAYFLDTPAPNTFPAGRPLLALDRIWVRPRPLLSQVRVHASPLSCRASDHLPLVAVLVD